jgi:hypothetical protein
MKIMGLSSNASLVALLCQVSSSDMAVLVIPTQLVRDLDFCKGEATIYAIFLPTKNYQNEVKQYGRGALLNNYL